MKIHLGCGKRYIRGWYHVDHVAHQHVDLVTDVRSLEALSDGCASIVYASHILQYFDQHEAIDVLHEWRRLLMPGGILRISVPNFAVLCRAHTFGLGMKWMLGSLYGRMEGPDGLQFHRCCYDEAYLRKILGKAGLNNARHWDWRTTEHADVDDFSQAFFPHMCKDGLQWNINMEADR